MLCAEKNSAVEDIARAVRRFKLVNPDQTRTSRRGEKEDGDDDWETETIRECFADPRKFADRSDVVVVEYRREARVSLESHSRVMVVFLCTWIGGFSRPIKQCTVCRRGRSCGGDRSSSFRKGMEMRWGV